MVDDYEVVLHIRGFFPKELKPQLTKDIKVIKEIGRGVKKETILSVTVNSESELHAYEEAKNITNYFLGFYSFSTLNDLRIELSKDIKIIKLTGDREPIHFGNETFIRDIDTKIFVKSILPYYAIAIKKGNEYLKIAIEYLRRARDADSPALIILDCISALEALFSTKNEKQEISYRLSNRVATLLADNKNERNILRNEIRNYYNLRSKLVHGSVVDVEPNAFGNLVIYVSESTARFLALAQKYENQDKIIDMIDEAMIDNTIIPKLKKESSALRDVKEFEYQKYIKRVKSEINKQKLKSNTKIKKKRRKN